MFDKVLLWMCVLGSAAALVGSVIVMTVAPYDWGNIAAYGGIGAGLAMGAAAGLIAPKWLGYPGGPGSWLALLVLWGAYATMFVALLFKIALFDDVQIFSGLVLGLAVPAFCLVRATLRLALRGRPMFGSAPVEATA